MFLIINVPLFPRKTPGNTNFNLNLLQPFSKKEDTNALKQKGIATIEWLSQEKQAVAFTDGSSNKCLKKCEIGILLLFPEGGQREHIFNNSVIPSNFTSELLAIRKTLIYMSDAQAIDTIEGLIIFSDSTMPS
ncbi:hypothetical protein TNIN_371321 [Trichonephila inaurata madagascariensis]|uniref:Uncharacterized protein n=1 Tax=Trichonephila inaurata madagascariensis TaxID=2747483 RepID=A0A8X7C482_9ARAC|nr:hypothetical protein TNIN_371321 [Trichonephila inaurata madagascariensis]